MRFPGFTDEWKKVTLGEIGTGFNYGLNAPAKEYDGMNKYIRITDIEESTGAYSEADVVSPNGKLSDEYIVNDNDILLARTGASTGKSYLYAPKDGRLYFAGFLIRFNVNKANPYFIYTNLDTRNYWRWVNIMSARSGQPGINSQEYSSYQLYIPSRKEQNKIANLLQLLDERISTQNKIIEDLKKLKSAIMAIIFGKSNVTKNQWREVRLGNICERVTRRNSNNISNLILTIAAQYGLVSQIDFFNKSVASADLSNYYLLDKGDFAYNKSYSGEYTWGAVKRLDLYPQGVLSPLYICFRPIEGIIDSDFLVYLFESKCWYREVSEICVEGARNHGLLNVSVVDFFNMKLHLPDLSEQKRIAEMMCAISDKIEHSSRLYALYNDQKAYLLSNMFI